MLIFSHATSHFLHSPLFKSLNAQKPISLFLPKNPNPNPTMSSNRPSAFDALMSTARAKASKRKSPICPPNPAKPDTAKSPKKPKPEPTENTAKSPNCPSPQNDSVTKQPKPEPTENVAKSPNCPQNLKPENTVQLLKTRVPLLKNKANAFDPRAVATWRDGERVPFVFLCLAFDMISNESGRIAITDIVCNVLRTVMCTSSTEDLVATVYLSANRVAAAHEGVELGIGDASIIKALAEACGRTEAQLRKQYKELGDLGSVAKASRSSQSMMRKPEPLTIVKVFEKFRLIAKESGKDSQEKKKNHIKALLVAATDCEPLYLIRLLQTKLRIGFSEQTLLAALGQAAVYTEKNSTPKNVQAPLDEAARIVKQVYSVLPVYDRIIPVLLSEGVWNLPKACNFTLGVPVGPMLAKPTKGVSEIVNKFHDIEYTCEYKYDGERAQIHYLENGNVEIYSRNAERNTGKFPDVAVAVSRLKKPSVQSFVLDCELVAYDREKQKILPFQILSTRARKNVEVDDIKVNVCIFAFDILYLNGRSLIQEQLKVRRELLYDSFEEEPAFFQFATAIASNDLEEIQKFLDASVDASCEGLIIKTLDVDATYEPSKRSNNWLKLKKDYMENIGDSLDLVPIGAFHGRGKRAGVYGAFLLACYDSSNEEFQSICKIGTGFSEQMLEERSSSLRSQVIPKPKPYYRFGDAINPDVWFEPTEVWEVKAADLTISPVYRAGMGIVDANKGISLRFPRLIRVREDKTPEQASSSNQIAEMYSAQKHNQPKNQDDAEDD